MLEDLNGFSENNKKTLFDILKTYVSDNKIDLQLFFLKQVLKIAAQINKNPPSSKTPKPKEPDYNINNLSKALKTHLSDNKTHLQSYFLTQVLKIVSYANIKLTTQKTLGPKRLDDNINDMLELVKKERKLNIHMRYPQLICLNPYKKSDDVIVFFPGLFSYTRDQNILIKYFNPFKEHIGNASLFICDWDAGNKNLIKMSESIKGERLNSIIREMKSIIIKIILRIIPYSTKIYKLWKDTCFIADLSGMIISREIWNMLTSGKKITIIGHSLGCKVIYRASEFIMQNSPNNENIKFEKIILLGGAEKIDRNWDYVISLSKSVVNLYSQKDKVLKHLYKNAENGIMPIGLSFIKSKKSHLQNKDCSDFVKSHNGYFKKNNMRMILHRYSSYEDYIPI